MKKIAFLAVLLPVLVILTLPSWSYGRRGDRSEDNHEHTSRHSSWGAPDSEERRVNPVPADAASLEQGGKLYRTYCAACHGETGRGDGPASANLTPRPANLAHEAGHERDGEVAWKIANGRPPMPAWKNVLTETQIWHVVNYLKSIGTRDDRGRHR